MWLLYRTHYFREFLLFFFQAEDGIRDAQESRGLGDVYKRQAGDRRQDGGQRRAGGCHRSRPPGHHEGRDSRGGDCLLYTSDAADDLLCVDLGGRRIIKKKKVQHP